MKSAFVLCGIIIIFPHVRLLSYSKGLMLTQEEIRLGYWIANGWPATFLKPITEVDEYQGQEILSIAYARVDDSESKRKKRLKQWCDVLPGLKIRMLYFHAVHQDLFDAATQIEGLEALSTGSGRLKTIESIANCKTLKSLVIIGCPSVTGMVFLKLLPNLRMLVIENVKKAQDLRFISSIITLEDFSICGSLWTIQKVNDLWPLTELRNLQVLRLYSTRLLKDGLLPLHHLKSLVKFECSLYYTADEFKALRDALPLLKYGTPIDFPESLSRKEFIKQVYGGHIGAGEDPVNVD